jgi:uncharacterized repeat protein (TIGR03806 family)
VIASRFAPLLSRFDLPSQPAVRDSTLLFLVAGIATLALGCTGKIGDFPWRVEDAGPREIIDSGIPNEDAGATSDAGEASDAGAGADAGADAGPLDAGSPFGLDARPSNTTCIAPAKPVENTGVVTQRAFPALTFSQPVLLLHAPGETSRLFVVQRGGVVKTFANVDTATTSTTFVDLNVRVNSEADGETGLLGMAFHPNFATNHQVFFFYSGFGGPSNLRSFVSRFTSNDNGLTLDPASEQILLTLDKQFGNHNGGMINFGPDGFLYISVGDGGSQGDPNGNAQNLNSLFGKMLRIDVDGTAPYAIPATNPFKNGGGRPELFAWGFRNPWRWSFDRGTGEIWVGDVGQDTIEEVDKVVLGGNYGWKIREAATCYNSANCNTAGLIDPIVAYTHAAGGQSITGGYVYRGTAIPSLVGKFVYGDYTSGKISAVFPDPVTGNPVGKLLATTNIGIGSFGQGPDGELYACDVNNGAIHKLVPMGTSIPSTIPATLSATGCVVASNPTQPSAGMIPYDVNSPLWSDGASKERFFAIPNATKIHINADGDWDLPNGSIAVKTFTLGGKRVETRLMMRHTDGTWAGYSYEWNDAQTDATLLPAGKTKQVGAQTWYFPSRAECMQCHTAAAGRTLGLENGQLNKPLLYPSTQRTGNQLATLNAIGIFDAPLAANPAAFPSYTGTESIEQRAKAYLHSNCSNCHRPLGTGQGPADFRFATARAQMSICNVTPQEGLLGVANAKLLTPQSPAQSIISLRMHALDANRMPPLGTHVLDTAGMALIDGWIQSVASCP